MATATQEINLLRANNGRSDDYLSEELLTEIPHPASGISHLASGISTPKQNTDPKLQTAKYTWREWLRLAQVARVLGTLALYIFLDGYEVRAKFARKALEKLREDAPPDKPRRQLRVWFSAIVWEWQDRLIRASRWWVFRSLDGDKEKRLEKQAVWLRENLIKLGPTFIKIGQSLGTRADLLPLPYIKELSTLQDNVPAFSNAEAMARIETELGRPVAELYAEIDPEPVAAASLGQVYRGRLHSGEEVAIKVQRPHLAENIALDIAILERITQFISRYPALTENADWAGMLREFDDTIHEEMDYEQESRNAERFRLNFKDWRVLRVPQIYWTHTTPRVLTMEFIRGTKVTDLDGLTAKGFSPPKVLRLMSRTYLKQLLEDGFFHADPHPGNLLVMDNGQLAFFDFGMTGRIDAKLQSKMIDAFFHVVGKDVEGLAQDLIDLDFLKPSVDPERVRPIVVNLFQHYLNLKLGDIRFKELTYELAEVMYDYPFRLPSRFTYIIRALMTLEGIGIITDPNFTFFDTAKPYAKEFMLRRESKQFRKLIVDKVMGRDNGGKIDWGKMWKLGKMAVKAYFEKR